MLAAAAAARFITTLIDLQAGNATPKVALTGGGIGIAMLEQIRDSPPATRWTGDASSSTG